MIHDVFPKREVFRLVLESNTQISKLMNAIEWWEADQPGFHLLCSGQVITGDKRYHWNPRAGSRLVLKTWADTRSEEALEHRLRSHFGQCRLVELCFVAG